MWFKYVQLIWWYNVMVDIKLWWASEYKVLLCIMRVKWYTVKIYDGLMRLISRRHVSGFALQNFVNTLSRCTSLHTEEQSELVQLYVCVCVCAHICVCLPLFFCWLCVLKGDKSSQLYEFSCCIVSGIWAALWIHEAPANTHTHKHMHN